MPTKKVYYIPTIPKQVSETTKNFLLDIVEEVEKEFVSFAGFLRVLYFKSDDFSGITTLHELKEKNKTIFYYGKTLCGIVGNVTTEDYLAEVEVKSSKEWKENAIKRGSLWWRDFQKGAVIGDFKQRAGILHRSEFDRFRLDWYKSLESSLLKEHNIVVIEEDERTSNVISHWDEEHPIYYIPIYRCEGIKTNDSWSICIEKLLELGFLPYIDSDSYRKIADTSEFWMWISTLEKKERSSQPFVTDKKVLEDVIKRIKDMDKNRANIPTYPNEIFQPNIGCWDLWPYTKYGLDNPPPADGTWIRLDKEQELYAKDPRESVAKVGEWAAIDFGTKSTMVAVWQDNGIYMQRIGLQEQRSFKEKEFENPTILQFKNIDSFIEAYNKSEGRPETKFEDILVSHMAKVELDHMKEYGVEDHSNSILMFQDSIKQWINDPNGIIYIYQNGEWHSLKYDDVTTFDPVEIYAYYIGLYLNNMYNNKIYLKYLLSYSATYVKDNLDKFKESFIRGLKKSFPQEIIKDSNLMKNFEVRLQLDEATAYAISAVLSYRAQAAAIKNKRWITYEDKSFVNFDVYKDEMQKEGLFYGVYDLGGGTLDFSFGLVNREGERDVFTPLERGGMSFSGCENMLEDIAYRIFKSNEKVMKENKFCCKAPFWLQIENGLVSRSEYACFNTISMIDYLRECWMEGKQLSKDRNFIYLRDEKGEKIKTIELAKEAIGNDMFSLDYKKQVDEIIKEKIKNDIQQFLYQFEYTACKYHLSEEKPRFIFLGGNASRAKVVQNIFKELIDKEEKIYLLHSPLPTDYDEYRREIGREENYPGAKSGVVYGLLMARPGNQNISIKNVNQFRYFNFHIGYRVADEIDFDPFGTNGVFKLVMSADNHNLNQFHLVDKIPENNVVELLYTNRKEYGFFRKPEDRLPANYVSTIVITVDERWSGYYLYCRPKQNSNKILELVVSSEYEKELDEKQIEGIVGWCNLSSNSNFTSFSLEGYYIRLVNMEENLTNVEYLLEELVPDNKKFEIYAQYKREYKLLTARSNVSIQWGLKNDVTMMKEIAMQNNLFYEDEKLFCCCDNPYSGIVYLYAVKSDGNFRKFEINIFVEKIMEIISK